jgi:hypothetical protein
MRAAIAIVGLSLAALLAAGCTVHLPFSHGLSYPNRTEARALHQAEAPVLAIRWDPPTFPHRVDTQSPSGFVGGSTVARIPTGPALTSRILQVLDEANGVHPNAPHELTIRVIRADTDFEYSAYGGVTPAIDRARCELEIEFVYGAARWRDTFVADEVDPAIGAASPTGVLESVWDRVALEVGRSVAERLATTDARSDG